MEFFVFVQAILSTEIPSENPPSLRLAKSACNVFISVYIMSGLGKTANINADIDPGGHIFAKTFSLFSDSKKAMLYHICLS